MLNTGKIEQWAVTKENAQVRTTALGASSVELESSALLERAALQDLYLSVVRSSVLNLLYLEAEYNPIQPRGTFRKIVLSAFQKVGVQLCHAKRPTLEGRLHGADGTSIAHTLLGEAAIDNVLFCMNEVVRDEIEGDFIETGVLRGGCSILMRAFLKAMNITDRTVWLADSFEGLPAPNAEKYPADATSTWHHFLGGQASLEDVKRNFERYGLLDNQVKFLKGWFSDTLPHAAINKIAVLRLDGDLYESTMDSLVNLYPKLSVGGFVIVDDYHLPCCREAIDDFRSKHGITDEVLDIDGISAFWRRTNHTEM